MANNKSQSEQAVGIMSAKLQIERDMRVVDFVADEDFVALIPLEADRLELVGKRRNKEWKVEIIELEEDLIHAHHPSRMFHGSVR